MPSMNALPIILLTGSSCSAEKAWWVICSMAVATSCRGSPSFGVCVLSWLRYHLASCRSPNQSSVAPVVSYVAPYGPHVEHRKPDPAGW
jgi:hypothetical protein